MDSCPKTPGNESNHSDNLGFNENLNSQKVPFVELPDDLFEEGLNPWKFSLIGRLYLQHIKFVDDAVILRQQWNLVGDCKLIPLGRGFFAIKLDNETDRRFIKSGQWEVLNQVLQIRNWVSNFRPSNQRTSKAQVWVRLPGLGLEFWKEMILFTIYEEIGTLIKIDSATAKCEVGYYSNVLVEVYFSQPIPNKIWIGTKYGGFFQNISIPVIPKYCHHCKIIGHLTAECRNEQNKIQGESRTSYQSKASSVKVPHLHKVSAEIPHTPFDICDRSEVENSPSKVQPNTSTSTSVPQQQPESDSLITNISPIITQHANNTINTNLVGGRFHIAAVTELENSVVKFIDTGSEKVSSESVPFTTWSPVVKTSACEKKINAASNNSNSEINADEQLSSKCHNEVVKNIIPGNSSGEKLINLVAHKYNFRRNVGNGGPKNLHTKP
ncbi:uncharacterized protein LOC113333590 [Papaver somniferum]|uniref:uncharacterized protein LOC113333590 n=1 Tax=Papaver somniferum TaxID=3469 RepID=UPI000E6F549C|nr:uncharacterized protein LOC113333590 [Papaver somniferum]